MKGKNLGHRLGQYNQTSSVNLKKFYVRFIFQSKGCQLAVKPISGTKTFLPCKPTTEEGSSQTRATKDYEKQINF